MSAEDAPLEVRDGRSADSYPWVSLILWFLLALAVVVARSPATFLNAQFWAEDGSVFFAQADLLGSQALTLPHAGYHHLLMRLWAGGALAVGLPVVMLPGAWVLGALLGWVAVATLLFSPRLDVRWPGVMLVGLTLVPATHEVWFNLTNVQWTLALCWPLWFLARDPAGKVAMAGDWLAMALVGLTGVFSVLAAPLMIARAAWRRSIPSVGAAVVTVVVAWIQWRTAVGATAADVDIKWSWYEAVGLAMQRVAGTLVAPEKLTTAWLITAGAMACAVLIGIWGVAAWRQRESRPLAGWWVFVALLVGAMLLRFPESLRPLQGNLNGERYFLVPKVLAVWLLIQVIAASREKWIRGIAVALAVAVLVMATVRFRLPVLPDNDWPAWAARIEVGENIGWVPITPKGMRFQYPGNPQRAAAAKAVDKDD